MTLGKWERGPVIPIRNRSGEVIPPFAVMEIDYRFTSSRCGVEILEDEAIFQVKKPTSVAAADITKILINSDNPIGVDGYGNAQLGRVSLALLSDASNVAAPGDEVGPVASSWYLALTGKGLKVKSIDHSTPSHTVSSTVKSIYIDTFGGALGLLMQTPSGGIGARSGTTLSSATCTLWSRSGSTISAASRTETVYNLSTTAVGGTKYIIAIPTNIGYVAGWEDC